MSTFEHLHGEEYSSPELRGQSERVAVAEWLKLTIRNGLSFGLRLAVEHGIEEARAEELLRTMETAGWLRLALPETEPFLYIDKVFCAVPCRPLQDFLRGLWGACPYCVAHSSSWRRTLDEDAVLLIRCDACLLEFLWPDWECKRGSRGQK